MTDVRNGQIFRTRRWAHIAYGRDCLGPSTAIAVEVPPEHVAHGLVGGGNARKIKARAVKMIRNWTGVVGVAHVPPLLLSAFRGM